VPATPSGDHRQGDPNRSNHHEDHAHLHEGPQAGARDGTHRGRVANGGLEPA